MTRPKTPHQILKLVSFFAVQIQVNRCQLQDLDDSFYTSQVPYKDTFLTVKSNSGFIQLFDFRYSHVTQ